MKNRISTIGAKLLALVENARVLAVRHQRRTIAVDTIRACSIYAKNLQYELPANMFEDLQLAILDKQSGPLSNMFDEVQSLIIKADQKRLPEEKSQEVVV